LVKKSSSDLKLSLSCRGTSQGMRIVADRAPAHIEEKLAHVSITCAPSLTSTNLCKRMLNSDPFAQLSPSFWGLLRFSKLYEQRFIRKHSSNAKSKEADT
jgi:hypothetical protein